MHYLYYEHPEISNSNNYYVKENKDGANISDNGRNVSINNNISDEEEFFCHNGDIQRQIQTDIKETKNQEGKNAIADGGCAGWLVVFGGVLIQMITVGIGISWYTHTL